MDSKTVITVVVLGLLLIAGSRAAQQPKGIANASSSDITLLARLIDAEARGESYQGKVAVGAVVVNRVRDDRFPSTIRGVIYEPGQFYTEGIPLHLKPSADSLRAAEAAIRGEDPTNGALFFYNPKTAVLGPWWSTRSQLVQIGNHLFLR